MLKTGLIIVVIGCIFFSCAKGWGTDWKIFSSLDDTPLYYDAENIIRPSKDVVRVWWKHYYGRGDVLMDDKYRSSYSINLIELNCAEKKFRFLLLSDYNEDGKVLFSHDIENKSEWNPIAPESPGEALLKAVCK